MGLDCPSNLLARLFMASPWLAAEASIALITEGEVPSVTVTVRIRRVDVLRFLEEEEEEDEFCMPGQVDKCQRVSGRQSRRISDGRLVLRMAYDRLA